MTDATRALFPTRAAIRRALALRPDAGRLALAAPLTADAVAGAPGEEAAVAALAAYLLDPAGAALRAIDEAHRAWLDRPLFRWVGPGNAAPVHDQVAALIAAPALATPDGLAATLLRRRFAPRADELVALAVAALPPPRQEEALAALLADAGPSPARLALATVQCGRALAWSPGLLAAPVASPIVEGLLALLEPSRPRPLLDLVARALGPLARAAGPLPARIRDACHAAIAALAPPRRGSLLAEVARIDRPRRLPDEDRLLARPATEVAEAAAWILGAAAPAARDAFAAHRAAALDAPGADALEAAFVDGLCAAAHVPALAERAAALLAGSAAAVDAGLALAARVPLDPLEDALVELLDDAAPGRRAAACAAVTLLPGEAVDEALAARLADPTPDVAAAATRALRERGRRDLLGRHSAREPNPTRRALVLAALGERTVPVIGELARGGLARLDDDEAPGGASAPDADPPAGAPGDADGPPHVALVLAEALLETPEGLRVAADLVGGVPDAAGLLALAAAAWDVPDARVRAPADALDAFARATLRAFEAQRAAGDEELAALALYLLARVAAGDEAVADVVAGALRDTAGEAGALVGALAAVGVATEATAAALAPSLAADRPIGERVLAVAAAGRALPPDHPAWAEVEALLDLGTIARAAAWSALRDRARALAPA